MQQCLLAQTDTRVAAVVDERGLSPSMHPVKNETGDGGSGYSLGASMNNAAESTPPRRARATGAGPGGRSSPGTDATPPDGQDDAALAVLACWDPEAFGQLYDRYSDQIYRFAYRRLRDRQGAEDATADVFFKALRAINTYKPAVAPFSAWLYRIAANAVTDHLRARRPVNSLDTAMETPDGADPVEVQAINRLEADRVWTAVDRLSSAQRTAVILRLGHDLPIAEIAALMERSEGAVKLLLNRGLTAVRTMLADTPAPERGVR